MAMTFATDVNTNGYTLKFNKVSAPTASGGTSYGTGSSGQVLKSNGTTVYWANDNNTPTAITNDEIDALFTS